jgi:hypothetical protein
MLPKKGRIFPRGEDRQRREPSYATAVGGALRQELGDTHQATKTVMRWTGAGERTVKNWFAGTSGPRGEHLLAIVRHSDAVFDAVVRLAGREPVVAAIRLVGARKTLVEMRDIIEALLERTPER